MGEGGGARVLIAEDDAAASRVLRQLLAQAGYVVTVTSDGEATLRWLDENGPPDVLLLDWMLPRVSGLDVCHRLRQRWNALELPILMVTAKADTESVYAAFDAGASDYVTKPFRGAELRARIAAQLRVKRLLEERRRMEEHLAERDKLFTLGLIAAGVAHDLNNPLSVIGAHAQLLARRPDAGETAAPLREILDAVERCRHITGDLLNFGRRSPAERGEVDVGHVLRGTLALREADLAAGDVRVTVSIDDALPPLTGDAHQLQQVFLNILVNAEHALRERGGEIHLAAAAEEEGRAVLVTLRNDGPPIPEEALPRIFDPFFTTKGDEGTGLGLAVCRRIVQEHGGSIRVESGADGTAFVLRLPVLCTPAPLASR